MHLSGRCIFQVERQEHCSHYLLKDMLLNGFEAVLFAEWIDKPNVRGMRPDLRQQPEINRIDSLGILSRRTANRSALGALLADGLDSDRGFHSLMQFPCYGTAGIEKGRFEIGGAERPGVNRRKESGVVLGREPLEVGRKVSADIARDQLKSIRVAPG
jgi:hypothetical protein